MSRRRFGSGCLHREANRPPLTMNGPHQRSVKRIGSLRSSQIITTYGPGALIDLPRVSAIVASLDTWRPKPNPDREIIEPRLSAKIKATTGLPRADLYPPPADDELRFLGVSRGGYVGMRRFPEWFVAQTESQEQRNISGRFRTSRRLVQLRDLDHRDRFDAKPVVATRFVRACPRGHVDDLDWRAFVHGEHPCSRPLWLDESTASGDLSDLVVRCECGKTRRLADAADRSLNSLGKCSGSRPWLGKMAGEHCGQPSRLLVRTATNAYFPKIVRVVSIPETKKPIDQAVEEQWGALQSVNSIEFLEQAALYVPGVRTLRERYGDEELFRAVERKRSGGSENLSVKQLEVNAFIQAPEGFGDDIPIDDNFHARRLPDEVWRKTGLTDFIDRVVQLHRLREVSALMGFTRLEAAMPDINGEYETDVETAALDENPWWFPTVENRGEGIFLLLDSDAVEDWSGLSAVAHRVEGLDVGHKRWLEKRGGKGPRFPGGQYILLHTLAHLLMQSVAIRCGYPAATIRERIYLGDKQYGILLYTSSPDADGTLGGLVQQARHIERHLTRALVSGHLCSSDPICAQHSPGESIEERWLHGAACHSCCLISETSCEMRNEYLDRALVVPTLHSKDAAFFRDFK